MAKRRNSFDPDALAKAGQEIAKRHQVRENVTLEKEEEEVPVAKAVVIETPVMEEPIKEIPVKETPVKKKAVAKKAGAITKNTDDKTQLCRIGLAYHRRLKFGAVKSDMTIRQFLEDLIEKNVPEA